MSDALTQKDSMSRLMVEPVQAVSLFRSEVRGCFVSCDGERKISSESGVRISAVESLRIPEEGSSAQGKSGPKPRTVES